MPFLDHHVLTVDTNILHKVDTTNPQNLFSMWTVFARCAESVEQGRRLENISWRLWNRETFCCAQEDKTSSAATSLPREIPHHASDCSKLEMPGLSGSVDSIADDEAVDFSPEESDVDMVRPRIARQDSCASTRSRGRERHISADDFEKIVVAIVKEKQPLSAPLPRVASPCPPFQKSSFGSLPSYERSGSTTTESPCKSSEEEQDEPSQETSSPELSARTTVVRGFSPSQLSVPRSVIETPRSVPSIVPEPTSEPAAKLVPSKKPAVFVMGGSYSSSEQDQSPDNARAVPAPLAKRSKMFRLGGSSEEDSSVKSALASPKPNGLLNVQKKQASFSNRVNVRTIDNDAAVADDSETDYVDESAIDDDDDSSDWEDSIEDSNKSSIDEKTYFKRVDSKANLTSRPSLITLMLAQNDGTSRLTNAASQSTSAIPRSRLALAQAPSLGASPNDSDEAPLMMKRGVRSSPLKPITEVPRSVAQPQPILATASHSHLQAALSPRTTRRNMLSTELTESLRRNILNERKQKSSTANAVMRRRHTSHDVANLKQYPEKVYMNKTGEEVHPENQYFQRDSFSGYHSKGW
ncbi:hypothetical protein F5X68DRAFT_233531 [Plectosphaerella plurivora]|uniref:Nitrogen regulatory protein areA GATA-like domain-containing protein n=1 Tax=Plectosphaerella plurivora TaxID=936078 RepID=A0A9P8V784_9PEZI|nr:hypothetical protein F5X68DRAFT_233531 [Plectosphaerella plurivora]